MSEEPKPCPCCGSPATWTEEEGRIRDIECTECEMGSFDIESWNTRTPGTATVDIRGELWAIIGKYSASSRIETHDILDRLRTLVEVEHGAAQEGGGG